MPFPVVVRYLDAQRGPDLLWTAPFLLDAEGGVVLYLAAGPAGLPANESRVAGVDLRDVPEGAQVRVSFTRDSFGRVVYGVPDHTPN